MTTRAALHLDHGELQRVFGSGQGAQAMTYPGPIRALVWGNPVDDRRYDGVWRRRGRAVLPELTWLLPEVGAHLDRPVSRVALGIAGWDLPHPPRIWFDGRQLKLGWFRSVPPEVVSLGADGRRISLLVVTDGED